MKHRAWMPLLFIILASATADAAEYWASCTGCSSQQAQQVAFWTVPVKTFGHHDVYVADFDRPVVHKYIVSWQYDAEFRDWNSSVTSSAADPHVGYEFEQLVGAIKSDVASLESGKLVPADVVGSAYDLVHSSVNRGRVARYIDGNMSLWESIGAPVFVPLSLFGKIIDLNLTVPVVFADGSTARFVLTGVDGSFGSLEYVFELVEDSLRDADGNQIPASAVEAAPFEGRFSSHDSAQRMIDFIRHWYGATTAPVVSCSSKQIGNHIIVTCKRN